MSKKNKKNETPKPRNWLAVHAFQRSGSGSHGSKKAKNNKNACRGKWQGER